MKQWFITFGWAALIVAGSIGCDSGYEQEKQVAPQVEKQAQSPESAMPSDSDTMATAAGALVAPEEADGANNNNEGVKHYEQGHWDVAQDHFIKALAVNPDLVEAHYNLALALDKLGQHGEATNHFQKALDLAPEDPRIKDSGILKAHLGG